MSPSSVHARAVVTASVPGRVCLVGESLDWMVGGYSVTAAVPLRTRVTAWCTEGSDVLTLISGPPLYRTRLVPAARAAAPAYDHDVLDHMQAAAKVILSEAAELAGVVVTASTDLPVGAGVSSSAALTLAVVTALAALRRKRVPDTAEACALAWQAETAELGTGAGWMDFLACAYGGVNKISAGDTPHADLIMNSLGMPVVLIDTRERHSTGAVLADLRERYRVGERAMLTYATEASALVEALTTVLRHPEPDYRETGNLLSKAHGLLRDLMASSTPLIEECIDRVVAAGAYGAKLSGSGHGGCLFALVPDEAVTAVLASLTDLPVHAVALPCSDAVGLTCTPSAADDTCSANVRDAWHSLAH